MTADEILGAYPDLEAADIPEALRYAAEALRAHRLPSSGCDAVPVRDLGMQAASDQAMFDRAAQEDRVAISADTDFGTLLAARSETEPSAILFRHGSQQRPADHITLLKANLPQLEQELRAGSIVVIAPDALSAGSASGEAGAGWRRECSPCVVAEAGRSAERDLGEHGGAVGHVVQREALTI
jgi:predicted nuclease of predicted toxin-antitoxin system